MLWQPTRGILQPNQHWRRPQSAGGQVNLTRAYFAGDIEPGLYPEQLYGRELALLAADTPETFEMQ